MGVSRRVLSGMVAALLFLPASASIPTAQWNIHLIQRLRGMKRVAPDTEVDLTYRKLVPFLPAQGDVGFHSVDSSDDGRLYYRAQYALVPRQLSRSTQHEFVIEIGPADAPETLSRDPRFHLVTSIHVGLRLFRKVE